MFILKSKFYEECARLVAKEEAKSNTNSVKIHTVRYLALRLCGNGGVKEVNRLVKKKLEQKK